jgi:hypothetical protein
LHGSATARPCIKTGGASLMTKGGIVRGQTREQ